MWVSVGSSREVRERGCSVRPPGVNLGQRSPPLSYLRLWLQPRSVHPPGVNLGQRAPHVEVAQLALLEGGQAAVGGGVGAAWMGAGGE